MFVMGRDRVDLALTVMVVRLIPVRMTIVSVTSNLDRMITIFKYSKMENCTKIRSLN